jgi:hypothetical protein
MNLSRNLHEFAPTESQSAPSEEGPVPLRQSRPIEVNGVFLGAAVEHQLGDRFIAVDVRVTEMKAFGPLWIMPTDRCANYSSPAERPIRSESRSSRHRTMVKQMTAPVPASMARAADGALEDWFAGRAMP